MEDINSAPIPIRFEKVGLKPVELLTRFLQRIAKEIVGGKTFPTADEQLTRQHSSLGVLETSITFTLSDGLRLNLTKQIVAISCGRNAVY